GNREYTQQCATCHSTNLRGGEMAPGLVGQTFISGWSGETLWTFADYTNATMPQDSPGNLSVQALNDVIAFILSSNDYPAGDAELSLDLESEGDPIIID
ncbi:MAG: c-type cytochrome, partial [Vicinamibacterales bacterium]